MRCCACKRTLKTPAATVFGSHCGPKCAIKAGLQALVPARAAPKPRTAVAGRGDPAQIPLELEMTA